MDLLNISSHFKIILTIPYLLTPPYLVLIITAVSSIFIALFNAENNDKPLFKKPSKITFLIILFIILICYSGIKTQEINDASSYNSFNHLNALRISDSLRIKYDSIRFDSTLNEILHQIKLQNITINNLNNVLNNQNESLNQFTGGNSYIYVLISPKNFQSTYGPINWNISVVNIGKYPIYSAFIEINEPIKSLIDYNINNRQQYSIPILESSLLDTLSNINGPRYFYKNVISLETRPLNINENIFLFEISSSTRNDIFLQTTIFVKTKTILHSTPFPIYDLFMATKITSYKKGEIIFQLIDPEFPTDSTGNVDWSCHDSIRNAVHRHMGVEQILK